MNSRCLRYFCSLIKCLSENIHFSASTTFADLLYNLFWLSVYSIGSNSYQQNLISCCYMKINPNTVERFKQTAQTTAAMRCSSCVALPSARTTANMADNSRRLLLYQQPKCLNTVKVEWNHDEHKSNVHNKNRLIYRSDKKQYLASVSFSPNQKPIQM